MRRKIITLFFVLFFYAQGMIYAQLFMDHNTGSVLFSVYDEGAMGHNDGATTGNGFVFMSNVDASFTGGFIMGNVTSRCSGHLGSFNIIGEMVNSVPFSTSSNPNFNQIISCAFSDGGAPVANRLGLTVQQTTLSNTGDNFVFLDFVITNNTGSAVNGVYVGQFQDWDVGAAAFASNQGGYDATRDLAYMYLPSGTPDPNYYGMVALSGMSGARVTTQGAAATVRDSSYTRMSTFLNETINTNGDYRMWIGSGPFNFAIGQSHRVGFAYVVGTNLANLQANTDAAQFKWDNIVVPVELTSFTASVNPSGQVVLNWSTATELNNRIFEIERRPVDEQFITIGFVEGRGTTTQPQDYTYVDNNVAPGAYAYRLKQIDFDGGYEYFDEIMVDVPPMDFSLSQNYPNPFNPTTNIKFNLAEATTIKLSVFNLLGEEVQVLVDEYREAGFYDVSLDASSLPSGTYFYKIETPQFTQTKKMLLTK
jgi:hypothetical protein